MCITESPETKSKVLANDIVSQLWFLFSHCCLPLFVTPWIAACQAPLSFTVSRSWLKLVSIESVMPSSHLILCCPLLLLPSIFPSVRVFSNGSALPVRCPKFWSFISSSKEYSGLSYMYNLSTAYSEYVWGDQTSQSEGKLTLNLHWRGWYWSWSWLLSKFRSVELLIIKTHWPMRSFSILNRISAGHFRVILNIQRLLIF